MTGDYMCDVVTDNSGVDPRISVTNEPVQWIESPKSYWTVHEGDWCPLFTDDECMYISSLIFNQVNSVVENLEFTSIFSNN